jgi:cell pole-organizing protein PopZ
MSEPNQEPTMEEILASIRRIISEDEATAPEAEAAPAPAAAAPPPSAPEPEPEPAPEPEPEPVAAAAEEDDVLELTQRVEAPAESHGDIDVYAAPEPAPQPVFHRKEEPLLSSAASTSIASEIGRLKQTVAMPAAGRTLEDVVRELLKPMLKDWLDENLPTIVRAKVEEEVERATRGPVR